PTSSKLIVNFLGRMSYENTPCSCDCHVRWHCNRWSGSPSPARSGQAACLCCHRNGCNEPTSLLQRVCARRRKNNHGPGRQISCARWQACEHRGTSTSVLSG